MGDVHVGQFSIEGGADKSGYLCQPIFNKKRLLMEGGRLSKF